MTEAERAKDVVASLRELADLIERTQVGVHGYGLVVVTRLADGSVGQAIEADEGSLDSATTGSFEAHVRAIIGHAEKIRHRRTP